MYKNDLLPVCSEPGHGRTAILIHQSMTSKNEIHSCSIHIKLNVLEVLIFVVYKLLQVTLTTHDLDLLTKNTAPRRTGRPRHTLLYLKPQPK